MEIDIAYLGADGARQRGYVESDGCSGGGGRHGVVRYWWGLSGRGGCEKVTISIDFGCRRQGAQNRGILARAWDTIGPDRGVQVAFGASDIERTQPGGFCSGRFRSRPASAAATAPPRRPGLAAPRARRQVVSCVVLGPSPLLRSASAASCPAGWPGGAGSSGRSRRRARGTLRPGRRPGVRQPRVSVRWPEELDPDGAGVLHDEVDQGRTQHDRHGDGDPSPAYPRWRAPSVFALPPCGPDPCRPCRPHPVPAAPAACPFASGCRRHRTGLRGWSHSRLYPLDP